jgi:crotonobetainyl-CoA:carnitine CoA-transferase CaiB-like acyl-CoA transferase
VFACRDGYLNIQAGAEPDYRKLCEALGLPELQEDPRFRTRRDRVENQEILIPLLEDKIRHYGKTELLNLLVQRGLVASPIYRADEMLEDPQVRHRGMHFDVPHPSVGKVPLVASPIRMSRTPVETYMAPPTIGQHTGEILRELLGYDEARIATLRAAGAI